MNSPDQRNPILDPQDTPALKRALVEAGRNSQLEPTLLQYSSRISTLLQNDTTLIHHTQLDAYIRALCPNVDSLRNLNDTWYKGQLETLKYCNLIEDVDNPVITAVDGEQYRAPTLQELKSRFTISHLLRIKRLHEGDGTPQNPPRSPVAQLVDVGTSLKKKFTNVTTIAPQSFRQIPGDTYWDLEADQPEREEGKQILLYDGTETKLGLIKKGRACELELIDGRPEMTREECQEGDRYLNADELAQLFIGQGFDLAYVDDLLALHARAVAREGGQPFDVENWSKALGNTIMGIQGFSAGIVPDRYWRQPAQQVTLFWDDSEGGLDVEGARAAVRVKPRTAG